MFQIFSRYIIFPILFVSCLSSPENDLSEQWKAEIAEAERNFAQLVQEKGIKAGFVEYAAEEAVLMRSNKIVSGKSGIAEFYNASKKEGQEIELSWKPEFIDVSKSGDLAYTYGQYKYVLRDSTGIVRELEGIFHTVWKRQTDGSWKYVWD